MIDLERLAREAGITERMHLLSADFGGSKRLATDEQLQRFAQLVAEEAARIASERGPVMAESYGDGAECITTADDCAAAIRSAFGIDATSEKR